MKKVIVILIICLVIVMGGYFLWSNPNIGEDMGNKISTFFDNLIEGKYVAYTREFEINELKISNSDYYFNKLTSDQQNMYTAVAIAAKNVEQVAKVKAYENIIDDIIITDASTAMEAFFADHPEVFYLKLEYEVYTIKSAFGKDVEIKLKYITDDKTQIEEQIKTVKSKVDTILAEITATSQIDREIQIHDKLCSKIEYYKYDDINNIPVDKHTIYGALVKNSAVCDGMSKAMQILLDKVGIENILVTGKIDDLHAWNLVKIENQWYHLDIISDKSIKDSNNLTVHSYFNVTTEDILKTHEINNLQNLPEANQNKYNYYIYKDLYINSSDDFNTKLQNIISKNESDKVLEFWVSKDISDVPDKIISSLQKNKNSSYLSENLSKVSYYSILNSYIIKKII